MTVTVFTKPRCPQCEATKRQLKRANIAFEVVDLTENPSTLEQLTQAGFRQAPVVITPDASWSGYRPDLIKQLAASATSEQAVATKTQGNAVLA